MVGRQLHDYPLAVLAAVEYDGWINAWSSQFGGDVKIQQLPVGVEIAAIASEAVLSLLCCDVLLPSGLVPMRRRYRILADSLDITGNSRHSHVEVMVVQTFQSLR